MTTKQKNLHRRWSVEKETIKKVSRRQVFQRLREFTRLGMPQACAERKRRNEEWSMR